MSTAINLLVYVGLSTSGLLLLRSGLADASGFVGALADPRVVGGGALYAGSFLSWLFALRTHELSLVYPLFIGSGYVAVLLASVLVLGESLDSLRLAGVVLVGLGIILLAT